MARADRGITIMNTTSERQAATLPPPLGRLAWAVLGVAASALALIGIVLPIIPGLPFAILAALCFANVSPRLHARLARVPAMRGHMRTWQRAQSASVGTQARTAAGLTLLGLVETLRLGAAALARLLGRGSS